jgi:hypothetical protein
VTTISAAQRFVIGGEDVLAERLRSIAVAPPLWLGAAPVGPLLASFARRLSEFVASAGGPSAFHGLVPRETEAALVVEALACAAAEADAPAAAAAAPGAIARVRGSDSAAAHAGGGGAGVGVDDENDARAVIDAVVHAATSRLLQLMLPSAAFVARARLPPGCFEEYLDAQEHVSGAALVRGMLAGELRPRGGRGGSGGAPIRVLLFTRTDASLPCAANATQVAAALGYAAAAGDVLRAGAAAGGQQPHCGLLMLAECPSSAA